jgi:hypothetical protein
VKHEREREAESVTEGWMKLKSSGKSERHLNTEGEKEHLLVKNFPGFTH